MTWDRAWRGSGMVFLAFALVGCVGDGGPGPADDGAGSTSDAPPASTGEDDAGTQDGSGSDGSGGPPASCSEDDLSSMYTNYVEPFVSGAVSQSCSQCHMTGIDISMYAQDTPCETMACMVEMGAVDLEQPASSSLLAQIQMGDPQSSVFDVDEEHAAMLEWIEWSAQCHGEVCGEVESPCQAGTGASSTGVDPLGDCSEDDLLAVFWDTVIADRGRCLTCHSDWGQQQGTFGPCASSADCMGDQVCGEGLCRAPGPWTAPHMFEGVDGMLEWDDPEHRQLGLNTMYNMVALGHIDEDSPLDSVLLTKPLLEGFGPTAVYGPGVQMSEVAPDTGVGVVHGGTSKFNFGYHEAPTPTEGVVDCRTDEPCGDGACSDGKTCIDGYCRIADSYCDPTYSNYVRFVEYFASCK